MPQRIDSRRKGSAAERELAGILHDLLGIRFERNLSQPRGGGHDLDPEAAAFPFAIEVKRHRTITDANLRQWWPQAVLQAKTAGRHPALAYRADRQPWRVVVPLHTIAENHPASANYCSTADLPIFAFATIARETLSAQELARCA